MPAPRKPSNILQMSGAFDKNPDRKRARKDEPIPTELLGDPPARLSDSEQAAWHEVVSIAPPGVLMNSDRIAMEILATLLAQFRADPHGFQPTRLARLESMIVKMGLTPADRSRVIAAPQESANPFAAIRRKP